MPHEVGDGAVRIHHELPHAGGDFAKAVRRHVGAHADGDARGAVHQQIGKPRGQYDRLFELIVEVGLEVDRFFVDVVEQIDSERLQSSFGIAIRRGRISVDRAEVALAVHQRHAQRELLHHAHERVIDGGITMWVILAQYVADHGRALLVRPVRVQPQLIHRVQNSTVHGLEPVPYIGKSALHDHAHRVVEERLPHLLF